jgi:phi13 family phage major tail protein
MQKVRLAKTITRIAYATVKDIDFGTGKVTYNPVVTLPHIAGGREFSADPVGDVYNAYADGLEIYSEDENAGYDISLTTLAVTDAIESDWYGNTVVSDGVIEYANQGARPYFALFLYEDTTDGIGKITFFGLCHISGRNSKNGKTKEDGPIDPQFPVHSIKASPRWDDNFVCKEIKGKTLYETVPDVLTPTINSLKIGTLDLVPTFDKGIRNYTAATTNATDTITASASSGATVEIKNGSTTVASGSAATWTAGENVVTVTAKKSGASVTYKIIVTKS